jgi:hypothetical protein
MLSANIFQKRGIYYMSISITEEQFGNALNLLMNCAKKKLQHSTNLEIAKTVRIAKDKDMVISQIETIIEKNSTDEATLEEIRKLSLTASTTTERSTVRP